MPQYQQLLLQMGKAATPFRSTFIQAHMKLPMLSAVAVSPPLSARSLSSDFLLFSVERQFLPRFDFDTQICQRQPSGELVSIQWHEED